MTAVEDAAERKVTLPTAQLLGAAWAACLVAGGGWMAVCWALGRGADQALSGAIAAGLVAAMAGAVIVGLRPWRPRSLLTWPVVWVTASFLRLVGTLGGAFLLYSATQIGGRSLWFAVALVYVAALIGETRVYAKSMRRFAPGGAEASTPEYVGPCFFWLPIPTPSDTSSISTSSVDRTR
jgi:hypothetical protein